MERDNSTIDAALTDLGAVTDETRGAGVVNFDTGGGQLIPMALSDD